MMIPPLRRHAQRPLRGPWLLAAVVMVAACAPAGPATGTPPGSTRDVARPPVDLALTDVDVVDVVAGRILPGRTVLVRDGRIVEIRAPGASAARPAATRTLAGEGRYLVPGLWDAHVHFRGGEGLTEENRALLPLYVANGVTTVRDAGGDITPALLGWRKAIRAGEMLGPRILTPGPKLDGPRPAWEGSIALASPGEVPAALDSLEALGVDYVKLYDGTLSAEVFLAAVDQAERRELTITGHMPLSVPFLEAVRRGFDAPEHLYYVYKATSADHEEITRRVAAGEMGFWDAVYASMERRDAAREHEVLRAMADAGMGIVPTLHIGDVLAWVDEDDHQDDPELVYIDPAVEETYQGRVRSARRASDESRRRSRELRAAMAAMVPRLHAAGVTVLAGSDAGPFNSYVYPGFSLHAEMEALVEAGLAPADALRAATAAPATFMGRGGDLGQVAEGFVADLVLLRGNPLEDIRNTRSVDAVILGGEVVLERPALDGLLESVRR